MIQPVYRLSCAALFAFAAAACAAPTSDDAAVADATLEGSTESAASVATVAGDAFYVVAGRDLKRCAAPMCGGYYVKRLNAQFDANPQHRNKTQCFDGSWQTQCYVAGIDYARAFPGNGRKQASFDAELVAGQAVVRASFAAFNAIFPQHANLQIAEAWEPRDATVPAASAYFARVTQPEIRCMSLACGNYNWAALNFSTARALDELRFTSRFTAADRAEASSALTSNRAQGILTAGTFPTSTRPRAHTAQQFYTRVDGAVVCIEIFKPVCGSDGKTYGNDCLANAAGVSVAKEGSCGVEGDSCGGHTIVPMNCAEGFFCNYAAEDICGFADASGKCAPKPTICTREYRPVCGCDGKTYGNKCTANAAGISTQDPQNCGL